MSAADRPPIVVDDRVRAALLWDVPALNAADAGAQQWVHAWRGGPDLDPVDPEDLLSVAAHFVDAMLIDDRAAASTHRAWLAVHEELGFLFGSLIELVIEFDETAEREQLLDGIADVVARIAEPELRARLLLRIAAYATLAGLGDHARRALEHAISLTDVSTRLGIVVRRSALGAGIEVDGFHPFAATGTPDDQLLSLPWVTDAVVEAGSTLAAQQREVQLRGIWDSSFHIGRTRVDDLFAALLQAEWCGALDLRTQLRRALAAYLLGDQNASAERRRWAARVWALERHKQVPAAIRSIEDALSADEANRLLASVADEPTASWQVYVPVALGVWDLLDDEAAEQVLGIAIELLPAEHEPRLATLLSYLLERLPDAWAQRALSADDATRAAMFATLSPDDVAFLPAALRSLLAEEATASKAVVIAARHETSGQVAADVTDVSDLDLIELLNRDPEAVETQALHAAVDRALSAANEELDGARQGRWGLGGSGDSRRTLGALTARLPEARPDVAEALIEAVTAPASAGAWQLGALEGLTALRKADRLDDAIISQVAAMKLTVGTALLGEKLSDDLLEAARLRVLAPTLDEASVAWLAVCARGNNEQARLAALAALIDVGATDPTTVQWSIVGGLFDPSNDVTVVAISALAERGASDPGAVAVATARLRDLYEHGDRYVRRTVVACLKKRPELDVAGIVDLALSDPSWIVRSEAAA